MIDSSGIYLTSRETANSPQPAALTKIKSKSIDRVGDQQVGLWSNEVSTPVGG